MTKNSQCGKYCRSEDMQRIMSFYPHNIRLTDFSGYFEKNDDVIDEHNEVKETIQDITFDQINTRFQNLLYLSGEVISIFITGCTRNEDMYINIHPICNFIEYIKQEGSYCDENNVWLLHIPIDESSFTKIIINWFKKQDIHATTKTISVGNLNIFRYYYNIFKLLKYLSNCTDTNNLISNDTRITEAEYESKPDDWFNLPAEDKYQQVIVILIRQWN